MAKKSRICPMSMSSSVENLTITFRLARSMKHHWPYLDERRGPIAGRRGKHAIRQAVKRTSSSSSGRSSMGHLKLATDCQE
jgi:hypothetical protein